MDSILAWIAEAGVSGILDIAFMALLIYIALLWFQETRTGFVLVGILIVFGLYLGARELNLTLTKTIFEKFFAVFLIALVIIFQEDLRHFFERVAVWILNRRLMGRKLPRLQPAQVHILLRTLHDLAANKIGALIVLRGKDIIARHLDGGVVLHGEVSEALLKSVFDPHSLGHDGAVVIEGSRVTQFSCHLPLSKNVKMLAGRGTRHASALGLAELTDALCLVVSEERGAVSVARQSVIWEVPDPGELEKILEEFYQQTEPGKTGTTWKHFFWKNYREKLISVVLALVLWFILVYSEKRTIRTYVLPLTKMEAPFGWAITGSDPAQVEVAFSGRRKSFYFLSQQEIRFYVPMREQEGPQTVRLSAENVRAPNSIRLSAITPREVSLNLKKLPQAGSREASSE